MAHSETNKIAARRLTHLSTLEGLFRLRASDDERAGGEIEFPADTFFSEEDETLFCDGGELALTPCTPRRVARGF